MPTRSFPQGLSAVIAFEPDKDAQYNAEKMEQAAKEVKSAEITRCRKGHGDERGKYYGRPAFRHFGGKYCFSLFEYRSDDYGAVKQDG